MRSRPVEGPAEEVEGEPKTEEATTAEAAVATDATEATDATDATEATTEATADAKTAVQAEA